MRLKYAQDYLKAFWFGLKNCREVYHKLVQMELEKGKIKKCELKELVEPLQNVMLSNFHGQDGNVTSTELLVISSLIAARKPTKLLELGTFDGNTTLQMALNSPENATVHTLDLPLDAKSTLDHLDQTYVQTLPKKFSGTGVEKKVKQHFGNSLDFDFQLFEGADFVFIDASHAYQYVKNDTEKVLKILGKNGVIVWHDFTPIWPGVWKYLHELSAHFPLIHIKGTTLVYCKCTAVLHSC